MSEAWFSIQRERAWRLLKPSINNKYTITYSSQDPNEKNEKEFENFKLKLLIKRKHLTLKQVPLDFLRLQLSRTWVHTSQPHYRKFESAMDLTS